MINHHDLSAIIIDVFQMHLSFFSFRKVSSTFHFLQLNVIFLTISLTQVITVCFKIFSFTVCFCDKRREAIDVFVMQTLIFIHTSFLSGLFIFHFMKVVPLLEPSSFSNLRLIIYTGVITNILFFCVSLLVIVTFCFINANHLLPYFLS